MPIAHKKWAFPKPAIKQGAHKSFGGQGDGQGLCNHRHFYSK